MSVVSGEFGKYTCDIDALFREISAAINRVQTATGRPPCAVLLNDIDIQALKDWYRAKFPDPHPLHRQMDYDGHHAMRMFGVVINVDDDVRVGVASLEQCPLPHPTPEDCVYHALTRRVLGRVSEGYPL